MVVGVAAMPDLSGPPPDSCILNSLVGRQVVIESLIRLPTTFVDAYVKGVAAVMVIDGTEGRGTNIPVGNGEVFVSFCER